MVGLEGQLNDIGIGDIVRIWKESPKGTYEVSGYVHYITQKNVVLSSNHPVHKIGSGEIYTFLGTLFKRKTYRLSAFDHYALQIDQSKSL